MKKIIITGINGQLGQYMAKYLIENHPDVKVIGTLRHKSQPHVSYIFDKNKVLFELMESDISMPFNEACLSNSAWNQENRFFLQLRQDFTTWLNRLNHKLDGMSAWRRGIVWQLQLNRYPH